MDIEQTARERLATLPGFGAKRAARALLTRLAGLTNLVFKVEADGEALCLRIPGAGSHAVVDRRREERNARAAAAAGVAPEVLHFGPDGLMLTRFVDGALVTPAHLAEDPSATGRVAGALRTLHDRAADFSGTFRVFDIMQRYVALLGERGAPLPARYRAMLATADAMRVALDAAPPSLRPCHSDPTGRNLIDTGERVWLIDWEFAEMNDPTWDLAYFSVESGLTDGDDLALLVAYLGRPPRDAEAARLAVVEAVCQLLSALWALVQVTDGNAAADFSTYAEKTFASAAARMEDADFPRHLENLRRG